MAQYYLTSHTYACEVSDGAIFFDLKHHRYSGIAPQHVEVLRRLVHDWPTTTASIAGRDPSNTLASDSSVAEALVKKGFLSRVPSRRHLGRSGTRPIEASIDHEQLLRPPAHISPRHLFAFIRAVCIACLAFRLRVLSMERVVHRLERKKRRATKATHSFTRDEIVDLVLIFRRLSAWTYTSKDACLFDSLAMHEYLFQFGLVATWVIGVRPKPFGAHCWVQLHDVVLNDTSTHAQDFKPILAA